MTRKTRMAYGSIERIICAAIQEEGFLSNKEIAEVTGIDRSTVIRNTRRLLELGSLRISGQGKSESGGNVFYYYSLVKMRDIITPVKHKVINPKEGQPAIKRRSASVNEVPYLKWWEGGGLYGGANVDNQETRMAA